jgi:hypothetical protein
MTNQETTHKITNCNRGVWLPDGQRQCSVAHKPALITHHKCKEYCGIGKLLITTAVEQSATIEQPPFFLKYNPTFLHPT